MTLPGHLALRALRGSEQLRRGSEKIYGADSALSGLSGDAFSLAEACMALWEVPASQGPRRNLHAGQVAAYKHQVREPRIRCRPTEGVLTETGLLTRQ